jgi:hypothetical protein
VANLDSRRDALSKSIAPEGAPNDKEATAAEEIDSTGDAQLQRHHLIDTDASEAEHA